MNDINLNNKTRAEDMKIQLKDLKRTRRELNIKLKMGMPMTDDEHYKAERIDADIQQVEYFIEWMEDTDKDDWTL